MLPYENSRLSRAWDREVHASSHCWRLKPAQARGKLPPTHSETNRYTADNGQQQSRSDIAMTMMDLPGTLRRISMHAAKIIVFAALAFAMSAATPAFAQHQGQHAGAIAQARF
jgi:hypothetical protein